MKLIFICLSLFCFLSIKGQQNFVDRMMYSDSSRLGRSYAKDPYVLQWKDYYIMYYSIPNSKNDSIGWGIGIAQSYDLNNWKKIGEINPLSDYVIEQKGICAPCAIIRNDTIHLFYQTYGNGTADAICHAWSTDGLRFERNKTNPVFRPVGNWNCGRAIDAEVFKYNDTYFLYFATRDKEYKKQFLGVATTTSESSFSRGTWKQQCTEPILFPELEWEGNCIEAASVISRNGILYMFYAGNFNNAPQQIGVAKSDNGYTWKRCTFEPFLPVGKVGEWNSSESGHPGIFDDGNQSYLFYQGNNDNGNTWFLSNIIVLWDSNGPKISK